MCARALLTVCAVSPGALVQVGALEMHVLEWLEPLELNLKEILSSLGKTEAGKKNVVHVGLTLLLMLIMNGSALFIKDLGLVVGLGGAILGTPSPGVTQRARARVRRWPLRACVPA